MLTEATLIAISGAIQAICALGVTAINAKPEPLKDATALVWINILHMFAKMAHQTDLADALAVALTNAAAATKPTDASTGT